MMLNGVRMEKSYFIIDCLEESNSIDEGSANWDIYLLKVFYARGLLLRLTNNSQGEYERIGIWRANPNRYQPVEMDGRLLLSQILMTEKTPP